MEVKFEIRVKNVMGPLAELVMVSVGDSQSGPLERVVFDVPLNERHDLVLHQRSDELAFRIVGDALGKAIAEVYR